MYYVKHTRMYPVFLTAQVDHYRAGKAYGFSKANALKIIDGGMGYQPPKPKEKGVICVDDGVAPTSSTAISERQPPKGGKAKEAAPATAPKRGRALTARGTDDGNNGGDHDPGAIVIPDDWETAHHLQKVALAKRIDPTATGVNADVANKIIQAELDRRAA